MTTPHPDRHDPGPTRVGSTRRPVLLVVAGLLAVVAVVALLHLTGVLGGA